MATRSFMGRRHSNTTRPTHWKKRVFISRSNVSRNNAESVWSIRTSLLLYARNDADREPDSSSRRGIALLAGEGGFERSGKFRLLAVREKRAEDELTAMACQRKLAGRIAGLVMLEPDPIGVEAPALRLSGGVNARHAKLALGEV